MITYTADSHQLYGCLYFHPAAKYPAGTMMPVYEWDTGKYLGEIAQVPETYSTVGNMNEHQLIITESTFGGRGLGDSTGIIEYNWKGDLYDPAAGQNRARSDPGDERLGEHLRLLLERRIVFDRRSERGMAHGADRQGRQDGERQQCE